MEHQFIDYAHAFKSDTTSIMINNTLHLFTNDHRINKHIIYDPDTKKIIYNETVPISPLLGKHGMVHLKSQNKLLFIAGRLGGIITWDIIKDKWSVMDGLKISDDVDGNDRIRPGIILTKDEKYVIIFGGGYSDCIDIFDVENLLLKTSDIKLPLKATRSRVFMIDNNEQT